MKKKLLLFACLAGMMGCQSPGTPDPAIPRDEGIEKQVETTLKKMSLDEKIGQMVQLTFDAMKYTNRADGDGVDIDEAHLDSLLKNYKVGSFLNTPNGAASTKEQWQRYLKLLQDKSLEHTGVPTLFGLDQNHGTTYTAGGTMFPQNINVAASFNTEMARKTAEITAYETRACSVPWTFSPTLDLSRDQRWPRQWEDYGEDPYLSSRMAEAVVKGFQGEDPNHIDEYHIATTPKHYMGYGVPVSGKDRTPAIISPQDLREKFFAPFKAAILAGGLSVMVNSASINGLPVHADRELLTGWLKEELNWDGVIVTDWADINNLYTREKVA
ncbi:MAG: glycoside hydrolase family 3 N-terminal domain-containing protein, partial [Bacteroidaceae bacterium]|nr:glycoside hydrolase family 3 N-terminal domain-containing protein [Bacteroidaceae bacterium]